MSAAEKLRYDALRLAPKSAAPELASLSADDLVKIFPDVDTIPDAFGAVANIRGFAQVAKRAPVAVRQLTEAQAAMPKSMKAVHEAWTKDLERMHSAGLKLDAETIDGSLIRAFERIAKETAEARAIVARSPSDPRVHFFQHATHQAIREVARLTPDEVAKIFPEGGLFPVGFDGVANFQHFADVVKAAPNDVRLVADGAAHHLSTPEAVEAVYRHNLAALRKSGRPVSRTAEKNALQSAFHDVAEAAREVLPKRTTSTHDSRFWRIERGPKTGDDTPALAIVAKRELDHNGALALNALGATRDNPLASNLPAYIFPVPAQLVVDGKALSNMNQVAFFGTHGLRDALGGFDDLSSAVTFIADELKTARAAGKRLDYVLLNACEQRDFRWLSAGAHAQDFQTLLNATLAAHGEGPVRVLAAQHGGLIYAGGRQQVGAPIRMVNGELKLEYKIERANFVEADLGPKVHFGHHEAEAVSKGAARLKKPAQVAGAALAADAVYEQYTTVKE
jgi:hypothetical protein